MDTSGFKANLRAKRTKIAEAARPAAQAGVQVIYDEARLNVPVSDKGHYFHGKSFKINGTKYFFEAGTLHDAIYQAFAEAKSGPGHATYHVAWNRQKAPYGHMVELGTSRAAAHPFLGPALHNKAPAAQQAMKAEFFKQIAA